MTFDNRNSANIQKSTQNSVFKKTKQFLDAKITTEVNTEMVTQAKDQTNEDYDESEIIKKSVMEPTHRMYDNNDLSNYSKKSTITKII